MKYVLAIDIGASSGRHILGWIEDGKIYTEEIYRFENNIKEINGSLVWDIESLVNEVKTGIGKCSEIGKIPETVAVDTWGVDYVLMDENKDIIFPVYSYRDPRTLSIPEKLEELIPKEELYKRTGIQKLNFNTVYQLYCDKLSGRLDNAKHFLMIPAFLSYCLTGIMKNEYTNMTTTGFMNAQEYKPDSLILGRLGIKEDVFGEIMMPGELIGEFTEEMQALCGFNAKVLFCPSHDTASAVAACPLRDGNAYISSGTWSLIGIETMKPVLTENAQRANFTNEGGIEHRFRFLKNYMGMWLFQNIRRNLGKTLSYDEMMNEAMNAGNYYYIDVNAQDFVAPENMITAIKNYLAKPDMTLGEVINSVYHSLARSYKWAMEEIESISGTKINTIHVVGGGSKDTYLCALAEEYTGKKVVTGAVETTALGNIISQFYSKDGEYTLEKLREIISNSYKPEEK